MPIPKPGDTESADDFMSRCMGDETMVSEYSDLQQRAAICHAQLRRGATVNLEIEGLSPEFMRSLSESFRALAQARDVEIKILKTRPDGSGVVEIPIIRLQDHVDFSLTEGGGPKNGSVSQDMLADIIRNAADFPMPITLGADGFTSDGHKRDRAGPQPGFVDPASVKQIKDTVYVEADLGPALFNLIVTERAYRGFSVELRKNLKLSTVSLPGWSLIGGVFTNQPGMPITFKMPDTIAAALGNDAEGGIVQLSLREGRGATVKGVEDMADATVELATAQAELKNKTDAVEKLETKLADAKEETRRLEEAVEKAERRANEAEATALQLRTAKDRRDDDVQQLETDLKKRDDEVKTLRATIKEGKDKTLRAGVVALANKAVKRGVKPAIFDGVEKDPLKWFEDRGFTSLSGLESFIDGLPETEEPTISSGLKTDNDEPKEIALLSREERAQMKRHGLDPKYAGVNTVEELAELKEKDGK